MHYRRIRLNCSPREREAQKEFIWTKEKSTSIQRNLSIFLDFREKWKLADEVEFN